LPESAGKMVERTSTEIRFPVWGQTIAARFWDGVVDASGVPIIALHGWLDNANSFAPLAELLNNPILAIDAAGHGYSDHRPEQAATHYIDHVRDVVAVADAQGWEQFILLGHSMGAGVACLVAATFPERVQRLLVIEGLGPPATAEDKVAESLRKAIDGMAALPLKRKPVYPSKEAAAEARTGGFGGLDIASAVKLCERGLEKTDGGWTWRTDARLRLASSLRLSEAQIEGFLRAIASPTLLIVGEQGMGGSGLFDHRLAWVNGLTVKRLPGRHHLHMENAAAVAEVITSFLNETLE
jgi:pimeloyl-ACP methyl ester carboxylesterase